MAGDGRRDPRGSVRHLIGTTGRRVTRPVLLYDTGCRLCRFAARVAVRLDRRGTLALLGLGDPSAEPLLAQVPEVERGSLLRLALPDGRLVAGGAAVLEVLDRLTATRLLSRSVAARRSAGFLYALVARNRDVLGRYVRDGPAPRRYP